MRPFHSWNLAAHFADPLIWLSLLREQPESSRLTRVQVLIRRLSAEMQQLDMGGSDSDSEEESAEEGAVDELDEEPRVVPIASAPERAPVHAQVRAFLFLITRMAQLISFDDRLPLVLGFRLLRPTPVLVLIQFRCVALFCSSSVSY
jgi:hypothetical protein